MPVGGSVGLWNGREVIWLQTSDASVALSLVDAPGHDTIPEDVEMTDGPFASED